MYLFSVFLLWIPTINGLDEPKLVYPRQLEERSSDGAMVMRVHDELTLNLRKTSVAAAELRVLTEENGKPVTHIYNGEEIERDLYEDEDKIATVTVTKDESGVYMNGLVGRKHRIEPVPLEERSEGGVVAHKIYEIEQPEMLDRTLRHTEKEETPVISERMNNPWTPVPDEVPIELFIVADGTHHSHFRSNQELLLYICVMANSVGLRYKAARDPRISLLVTGVEMPKTEPYAELYPKNPNYMEADVTVRQFSSYAYGNRARYGYPDVVYLMTRRDVYSVSGGKANVLVAGIGFVSSVCTESFVALGEDKPGMYTGMHTLTHELAHVLGSEHDGEGPKSAGHPGAKSCSWDNGNIMSYIDKGPSHHQFSWCSLQQMQYVIRKAGPSCWKVRGQGHVLPGAYPGMLVSQMLYCREVVNDPGANIESYSIVQESCKIRCVFYKWQKVVLPNRRESYQKLRYYQLGNALDYTICAASKVCLQGICVKKPNDTAEATTPESIPSTIRPSNDSQTIPTVASTQCACDCSTAVTLQPQSSARRKSSDRNSRNNPSVRYGRLGQFYRTAGSGNSR